MALLACLAACSAELTPNGPDSTIITIIGTNDLHGAIVATNGAGGLHIFSGYVNNIRARRAADGGAVLLIDAGDMWQGTLESNLGEGASVVRAYNALGYAAAAIGNHEFDYGPTGPRATPESETDDARGALKARAAEAKFPLLSANLIDDRTGVSVGWPNVSPSIMIEAAGIKMGIVGAITEHALATTNVANIKGLSIAPLVSSISLEAEKLRRNGADVIIVAAHAGSECVEFGDPDDLASCQLGGEIFRVARNLPRGLVDVIVGGHVHKGIAHNINGISVISSFSSGRAFGRVDVTVDRNLSVITNKLVYPPEKICEFRRNNEAGCSTGSQSTPRSVYAGATVMPDAGLEAMIRPIIIDALRHKARKIGVVVESEFVRSYVPESPLGNLLADIMLDMSDGADVAIHNTVGGIRADLPSGSVTFGSIYELFPFDNRIVDLSISGADLRKLFEIQFQSGRWAAGVSGLYLIAECLGSRLTVSMLRNDGHKVSDQERLAVVTTDFLASGGDDIFSPIMPAGGFKMNSDSPRFRDRIVSWFERHQGSIRESDFYDAGDPRFTFPSQLPISCDGAQ